MKIYCVGGALRDELLGLPVQDRDWVVVGATPEALLAQGYLPVGKDFPVFLHPKTHEEYALARTERKTGPGYRGFVVQFDATVSLQDDLLRRDLTINAMAKEAINDAACGPLIDPFGGERDLRQRLFRHVSPAFSEDPVRVLRLARFAARFHDFRVAPETLALVRQMASQGELASLVAERVWQESSRGLMEAKPSRMFDLLHEGHALTVLSSSLDEAWHADALAQSLDRAAERGLSLEARFAVLTSTLANATASFCEQWKVPTECKEVALAVTREFENVYASHRLDADGLVGLIERLDARRRLARFHSVLSACQCIATFDATQLLSAQAVVASIDEALIAQDIVQQGVEKKVAGQPSLIKTAIHDARIAAVRSAMF